MTRTTRDLRGDNIIDSRDVIARVEALEELAADIVTERADFIQQVREAAAADGLTGEDLANFISDAEADAPDMDEDDAAELIALKALADEAEGSPDWRHGETLIRDEYFTEYAQQLAEDLGYTKPHTGWPYDHIDWEAAADALKMDYFSVTLDGEEYWIRS